MLPLAAAASLAPPVSANAVRTDCPKGLTPLADQYWDMQKLCDNLARDALNGKSDNVVNRFEEAQRFPEPHADSPPVAKASIPPQPKSRPDREEAARRHPRPDQEAPAIDRRNEDDRRGQPIVVGSPQPWTGGVGKKMHRGQGKEEAEHDRSQVKRARPAKRTAPARPSTAESAPAHPSPALSPATSNEKKMGRVDTVDRQSVGVNVGSALLFGVMVMFGSALLARRLRSASHSRAVALSPSKAGAVAVQRSPVDLTPTYSEAGLEGAPSRPLATQDAAPTPDAVADPPEEAAQNASAPSKGSSKAKVQVLGPLRVVVGAEEVSFRRTEGRDLFALLATSRDGESPETVIDRLWPDEGERGIRRLESAIMDINASMRQATGLAAEVKFVLKTGQRRRLAPVYFDVDWWRFEDSYVKSNTAENEADRLSALRQMVTLYQGPLLADRDDLWCLPLRQAATDQAVNAALRLADLESRNDPYRALDVLTLAVDRIDSYNELLWCQMMTIQSEVGRLPAVRRTFQQMSERLAEIDAQPSRQVRQAYQRLLG
ncbi:BTAD domain-containing putative transcriptional regulator [Spongiactinospora sp. 9N601]|uniref:AfsR/SARP family transcriptional regulator n=1 Tax=Spongiactinospora sp. 9N601 TaxID=3375149 RepID=UPI0037AD43AC